ncbi:MAG TPA: hypothetical protein DCM86_16500 [Verrucomicrobiales bacterium]|nr:hypothetical protein [Verrucomicrobiales bacterium]
MASLLGAGAGHGHAAPASVSSPDWIAPGREFLKAHCTECHDADTRKGGLDLESLPTDLADPATFARWVTVHDRVESGEMPPRKKARPAPGEQSGFTALLASALTSAERSRVDRQGRAVQRRLNRYEYEEALRDLLQLPWLQVRDSLPEDGEAHRFNKVGEALDISHVQMARYLSTGESALRQAIAPQAESPARSLQRYYARDQRSFTGPMKFSVFNTAPERATFPVLGFAGQPEVRSGKAPITSTNAAERELEGMGVVASAYEPIEPKFNQFKAPVSGRYRIRLNAYSVWVGAGESNKWYIPNLDSISRGRRDEPVVIYSETPPRLLRWLGKFDITPEPGVHELEVFLLAGEMIRPDAGRLFRSRPGPDRWQNPLAERDGQPGVVFRWLEVDGPICEEWPPAGHRALFGDLPLKGAHGGEGSSAGKTNRPAEARPGVAQRGGVEVVSRHPMQDAQRLLAAFLPRAYRHPVPESEARRFLPVVKAALRNGSSFTDAMVAAYTAVISSPGFLCLEERPGPLDDYALASRLSFFLWNSPPDDRLLHQASEGRLGHPEVLRAEGERLLGDPRSRRFVDAFLDYWLDLRKIPATAPDADLYSDYYLDDLLTESALEETQLFFAELLRGDLPTRSVVTSDFAMLNERLAVHYGVGPVHGVAIRRTPLPAGSPRGGLMTQAAVLKVTANGTTTSPVVRGAWIMERILGQKPPPPPAGVPAVEPDTRGASTIRQQLERHRSQESCNGCHAKIDPAGFALESFDVMGGWRERYRAVGGGVAPEPGLAKSGQKFVFHQALPVDASGALPDGRPFRDVRELKELLARDERGLARNLARQLVVFATGAPVSFSDRVEIERLLDRAAPGGYGVRTLILELIQSRLFREK